MSTRAMTPIQLVLPKLQITAELRETYRKERDQLVADTQDKYSGEFHQELSYWQVLDIHRNREELLKCNDCTGLSACKFPGRCGMQFVIQPFQHGDTWHVEHIYKPCKFMEQASALATLQHKIAIAEIPPEFVDVTFDDIDVNDDNRVAYELCKQLLPVYLYGAVGCGKTMLVSAMANAAIRKGVKTLFITVPELITALRPSGDDPAGAMIAAKSVSLLILDDFGAENTSAWVMEQLFMLINYRYSHKLATCFTSNHSLSGIAQRLASRIKAMCNVVYVGGGDRRA